MVLVGPSGCGKSTTLRMLAGLEEVNAGKIFIGDRDVTHIPPKDRDIAMVFQNYALYPHMTRRRQHGLRAEDGQGARPTSARSASTRRPGSSASTEYLERKPKALSGGQRQRVAMGRAIVRNPQVFCMDEPLSNLDAKMRVQTRTDIAKLQADLGVTTVYVTHDQVEAMTMGDRVAVMKHGDLQQVDTPLQPLRQAGQPVRRRLHRLPADEPARGHGRGRQGADRRVPRAGRPDGRARKMQGNITVGVRPEAWRLVGEGEGGLPVEVTVVEELGADAFVYGTSGVEGTPEQHHRPGQRPRLRCARATTIHVTTDPQQRARLRHRHRGAPLRLTPTLASRLSATGGPRPARRVRRGRPCGGSRRRRSRRARAAGRGPCPSMSSSSAPGIAARGGAAAGDVHHLVGEAVHDQGRARAAPRSRGAAVGLGEHGQHLPHHAAGADARGRRSRRARPRTSLVGLRVAGRADQPPDRRAGPRRRPRGPGRAGASSAGQQRRVLPADGALAGRRHDAGQRADPARAARSPSSARSCRPSTPRRRGRTSRPRWSSRPNASSARSRDASTAPAPGAPANARTSVGAGDPARGPAWSGRCRGCRSGST